MIVDKDIYINITARNLSYFLDFGIIEFGIYKFNSIEMFEWGTNYSYDAICDVCHNDYKCHMWKFERMRYPIENVKYCPECRHKLGSERMKETRRDPSKKHTRSARAIKARKDHPDAFKRAADKRKNGWCKTEHAKEVAIKNLKHYSGEDHPKWNPNKDEFSLYCRLVDRQQSKWDLDLVPDYDPNKRALCGVDGGYQLDHIISKKYGFDNKIDPYYIGHICNLQFIPWEENRKKHHNTDHKLAKQIIESIKKIDQTINFIGES